MNVNLAKVDFISPDDLASLQYVVAARQKANAAFEVLSEYLVKKYQVGARETIELSGKIVRDVQEVNKQNVAEFTTKS